MGALAAAAASLTKAIRLPLLATAQPFAWQQAQRRWLTYQSALALAAFAAAACLLWFGDSLISGFAVLAALMLGAALILPMFLELVLSLGQRYAHGAARVWFWADSRQQLSGLSLALMALLLALAVNVGVGTMVESFSRTFLVWLDGRLAADVYVSAADDAQATRDQGVAARASRGRGDPARRPRRDATGGRADRGAGPARSRHLSRQLAAAAIGRRMPGPSCVPAMRRSSASNWRGGCTFRVGDRIEVPAPGGNWTLDVVGIYADYGNPKGQIAVNFAALTRRFPEIPLTRMGLRVAPPQDPGADLGAAGKIRARRSQRRRSGDDEGGIDADLQPHLLRSPRR